MGIVCPHKVCTNLELRRQAVAWKATVNLIRTENLMLQIVLARGIECINKDTLAVCWDGGAACLDAASDAKQLLHGKAGYGC